MIKRFEEFTPEDLWTLRKEIVLNSMYTSDYHNSFGIDPHSVQDFFDAYVEYLDEVERENIEDNGGEPIDDTFDFYDEYDNIDNLYDWFCCYEDFSWVQYEIDDERYSVFHKDGLEANDYYLTLDDAIEMADNLKEEGYDVYIAELDPFTDEFKKVEY